MRHFYFLFTLLALCLCPVYAHAYSTQLVEAFKQADEGNFSALRILKEKANDPVIRSAAQWMLLRDSKADFYSLVKFIDAHPDWPSLSSLKQEAEEAIDFNVLERDTLRWFQNNKPVTYGGTLFYITLLKKNNNVGAARNIARGWWRDHSMTRDQQREFYTAHANLLSKTDHEKRIRFLFKKGQYEQAQAVAQLLGSEYNQFVAARVKLAKNENGVNAAISNLSSRFSNHPDLLYERLKWRRKNNMDQGAIEILDKAPSVSEMHDPSAWWRERHIIIRRLLEDKNYQAAYKLASNHKQIKGFSHSQAQFVAGWIALRFVNKPYEAFEHFEKLYNNVETPISRARGSYWAGRASEDLGHPDIAQQWYAIAAQYQETFYGQLAAEKTPATEYLAIKTAPAISNNNYHQDDRVKVAKLFGQAGLNEESRLFLFRLLYDRTGQKDLISLAALSRILGHEDITIKAAQEIQKKYNQTYHDFLYPRRVKQIRTIQNVEWALVHALIRQESRFDKKAISPAGARGLMQLMPATAKETAKQYGIRHNLGWLTTREDHNIALGSQYIGQLLRRFDGSYAMAAAGYNAGPSRVDRWKRDNGNPQTGQIDLIDWIELIPIYETRNYVQRVLEGTHVYRQYLKGVQQETQNTLHLVSK